MLALRTKKGFQAGIYRKVTGRDFFKENQLLFNSLYAQGLIRIRNGRTGEVVSYKDTYQIRPLVTAGAAWHNDLVTLTADGDLTETKGFKSEDTSQYVGVGAEVTPLSWLAVRAGYRADVKGNDSNVFTGGVGFAPFSTVHVDLMGLYGEDETWGAGAQLSMTF